MIFDFRLIKLEIIGNCSDLIMIALGEFRLLGSIECELDSGLVRDRTAFMHSGHHLSGGIDADLYDDTTFLIKRVGRLRQRTLDAASGEAP